MLFHAVPCFAVQAILNASVDGHKHGVHSLMLIGQHLFSGDRAGTLKVSCRTANQAHGSLMLRAPVQQQHKGNKACACQHASMPCVHACCRPRSTGVGSICVCWAVHVCTVHGAMSVLMRMCVVLCMASTGVGLGAGCMRADSSAGAQQRHHHHHDVERGELLRPVSHKPSRL